jgi:flagellar M-ring protein FliF
MENALATTGAGGVPAAPATKFANPLTQIGGIMKNPAVKRSLPMIFIVGLVLSAALAWMALATPPQRTLFPQLPDSDKQAVVDALSAAKITSHVDDAGGITVAEDDYHRARILLAGQGLPKAAPGGYAILDQLPMGVSRAVEGERLRQARETELAKSTSPCPNPRSSCATMRSPPPRSSSGSNPVGASRRRRSARSSTSSPVRCRG